jgi:hypothetical protein
MRIFKLSLGKNYFNEEETSQLYKHSLVSVHPDTKPKGQSKKSVVSD